MLLTASLVLLAAAWYWFYWRPNARLYSMLGKLPGPLALPLVGNAYQFGTNTHEFLNFVEKTCKEYRGRAFRLWLGPECYVILTTGKDIETILSSNKILDKGGVYDFLLPWLGTGLLTSTGPKWKRHRKILTPTFHFKILEDFVDVFNANGEILVEALQSRVGGPAFDMYKYITLHALDIICETAMGVKVDAQRDKESSYVRAVRDMSDVMMKRSTRPWLGPDFLFNLTKYKGIQDKALKILHDTTNGVIKERREEVNRKLERLAAGDVKATEEGDGVKKRLAFLDMLIESTFNGSLLTDQNIREEVDTFMFEGHDTTASAMSFCLWLLSRHQDVQDKVFQELQDTFPDPKEPLTFRGLQDLKYMDYVVKESLRLYPSVPLYARHLLEDVELEGGLVVPKGGNVTIASFMAHRDPEVFPEPDRFNPDRFLPENAQGRHPYIYVPFSAGPRNCIGQKFAMLEMKSTIAHILRHYRLLPEGPEPTLKMAVEVILVSLTGVPLKIVARD